MILQNYDLIILRDINIDVSVKNACTQSKTYLDILMGIGLKNLISKPTRITNTSATILDHILTNLPYESVTSGIMISDITDHLPVFGMFNLSLKTRYYRPVYYRSLFSSKKMILLMHLQISYLYCTLKLMNLTQMYILTMWLVL